MARHPSLGGPESPTDFPQVEPQNATELFPINNIRWVISETAKLSERVDTLRDAVDRINATIEKGLEKQSAATREALENQSSDMKERLERQSSDIKERLELFTKPVEELKNDVKDLKEELHEVDKTISWAKGSIKTFSVLGGLLIIILSAVFAALARKLIG